LLVFRNRYEFCKDYAVQRLPSALLTAAILAFALPPASARSAGGASVTCYGHQASALATNPGGAETSSPVEQLYVDVATGTIPFAALTLGQQVGYAVWAGVALIPGPLVLCAR
jgi:hypothetical protein